MPNLSLGLMAKEAAKARFRSFNLTLPAMAGGSGSPLKAVRAVMMQGQLTRAATTASSAAISAQPVGAALRPGATAPSPAPAAPATATPMSFPPALFRAASNSKDDVDYQKGMHDMFSGLFDGIIDAIEFGFNMYRIQAGLVDVQVNGPIAMGGRLEGPPIDGLISRAPAVAAWNGWDAMVRDAVARGFEHQWSAFARGLFVPSLPWYPAFAAFPGPQAPPMPNVPTPLIVLAPTRLAELTVANLKMAMYAALNGQMDFCHEFFDSIATALQLSLLQWAASQQVMLVMGFGPIPTFAPPYVPVGPVVGGSILRGTHIFS